MEDISLHILDIAENAIKARARKIIIDVVEDETEDRLTVRIDDDGEGMNKRTAERASDPFFTTKNGKRVGLGLALLSQTVRETGGSLKVDSAQGKGTTVTAIFVLGHPDMKPMGDLLKTMAALVAGNPSVRFIYNHKKGDCACHYDSFDALQADRRCL